MNHLAPGDMFLFKPFKDCFVVIFWRLGVSSFFSLFSKPKYMN